MKIWKSLVIGALILPTTAYGQSRGPASQEQLSKVNFYIQRLPEEACKLPQSDIEKWIRGNLNGSGLITNVGKTVFFEPDVPPKLTGLDALMERTRQETERREAEAAAFYSGRQVPVGQPAAPATPRYRIEMHEMKATDRIASGLNCSANVIAASLRFSVAYTVTLDATDADGWKARLDAPPFTEEFALEHPDRIKVSFEYREMSLADARAAGAAAHAASLVRQRQADAATPRHTAAAYRSCQAIEGGVKKIIEGNSNGAVKVLEVSTFESSAGVRADGTLSCSGEVFTNRGRIFGTYGTSRSPKGQLLIEWRPQ